MDIATFPVNIQINMDDLVDEEAWCTACVFLTTPAAGLGKHAEDPANPGNCFCPFIHGKLTPESQPQFIVGGLGGSPDDLKILHAPRPADEEAEHEERSSFAEADAQAMGQILVVEHDDQDPYALYEAQRLALRLGFQRSCDNGHRAPWGFQWFETWQRNIEEAVQQRQGP